MRIFTDSAFRDFQRQQKEIDERRQATYDKNIEAVRKELKEAYSRIDYLMTELNKRSNYEGLKYENEAMKENSKQIQNMLDLERHRAQKLDMVVSAQKLVLEAYSGLPALKGVKK